MEFPEKQAVSEQRDYSSLRVPGGSYTDVIFNLEIGGSIGTPGGTAHVTVDSIDQLGNPEAPSPFDYTLSNGNNFLTITTSGGESIVNTSISYPLGFTDLRQIRISGAVLTPVLPTPTGGGGAVPEPSTLALLALGGLGLAVWRRWKGRRSATPA